MIDSSRQRYASELSGPFDEHHRSEALAANCRYGRFRHPAALNFGDCIAYATARLAGEPLLFVGDDFTQTDVEPA